MTNIINRSIFFPKINEPHASLDKIAKTRQIKHQILADIAKNDAASIYNIKRHSSQASACTVRKQITLKGKRKVICAQDKRVRPYKISNQAQAEGLSRRHSICISDLHHDNPSVIIRRLNHNSQIDSIRQSLERIRNNLKIKLLRFKTQMNSEIKEERRAKEDSQFNHIFSIRSISKSMKAKNALQYRLQVKKFFRSQPLATKLAPPSPKKSVCHRMNEFNTSINGWVIAEQDISLSNNMNNTSTGQQS